MIYLIGGSPKCGKTTLAKKLSLTLEIPWLSTDSLQSVVKAYTNKRDIPKKFPWSIRRKQKRNNDIVYDTFSADEIIRFYRRQAESVFKAIEMMTICEIIDGNDLIIEGYHLEPSLVARLQKKYGKKNIRGIFLIKTDAKKFVKDITRTNTPNDWIITKTKNKKTYSKIAEMICKYGKLFKNEAKKKGLSVFNMDDNFNDKINNVINYLKRV
jgi:2-phosphoglycerate kinase